MDTHTISRAGRPGDTLRWLNDHGYVGGATGTYEDARPALLFRSATNPNEPPKLAVLGDTLVADGRTVTIADPTLKGPRS